MKFYLNVATLIQLYPKTGQPNIERTRKTEKTQTIGPNQNKTLVSKRQAGDHNSRHPSSRPNLLPHPSGKLAPIAKN